MRSGKKTSLAEQILALSNPQPVPSFHLDEEEEDETTAKVCDFTYEEDSSPRDVGTRVRSKSRRVRVDFEEDTKYAGRVVSRRDLETREGEPERVDRAYWMTFAPIIGSNVTFDPSESEDSAELPDDVMDDESATPDSAVEDEGEEDDDITSSQSDSNVDATVDQCEEVKGQREPELFSHTFQENMEKGKAARHQIS